MNSKLVRHWAEAAAVLAAVSVPFVLLGWLAMPSAGVVGEVTFWGELWLLYRIAKAKHQHKEGLPLLWRWLSGWSNYGTAAIQIMWWPFMTAVWALLEAKHGQDIPGVMVAMSWVGVVVVGLGLGWVFGKVVQAMAAMFMVPGPYRDWVRACWDNELSPLGFEADRLLDAAKEGWPGWTGEQGKKLHQQDTSAKAFEMLLEKRLLDDVGREVMARKFEAAKQAQASAETLDDVVTIHNQALDDWGAEVRAATARESKAVNDRYGVPPKPEAAEVSTPQTMAPDMGGHAI
jgi:hypothetical protein